MRYHGNVIRPPSEANSYILQVTYGCSHNRCGFCGTYPDKPFSVRPTDEVFEDIAVAGRAAPHVKRVFLADGNAMVLSPRRLHAILDALADSFPRLHRVGAYTNARDLLSKTPAELAELRDKGLRILYMGLESGSEEVLRRIDKSATAAEMVEAVQHAHAVDIKVSVIGLLGLGGVELSAEHAEATGRVVTQMSPRYLSLLTLMLVPGTPLYQQHREGTFQLPEPEGMLREIRIILQHTTGLTQCIFRTNHASNYLPLAGVLCRDKDALLATLDDALAQGRSSFRPESWRAL